MFFSLNKKIANAGFRIRKFILGLYQRNVYVFGDSHTEVFSNIKYVKPWYKFKFIVTGIGGATAQGMRNPNSKTNALQLFKEKISEIPSPRCRIYLMLGEVDTGFVMWYRAQKYHEDIELQLENSVEAYFQFVDFLISGNHKNITVFSAPLPTIEDHQDWGEVANARKEIRATKRERTLLTIRYNNRLQRECAKRNIRFVSTDEDLLDQKTGLIRREFKNKDVNNHHLDLDLYTSVILKKI